MTNLEKESKYKTFLECFYVTPPVQPSFIHKCFQTAYFVILNLELEETIEDYFPALFVAFQIISLRSPVS